MQTTLPAGREDTPDLPQVMLLDCYMELLAYTVYLVQGHDTGAPSYEDAAAVYEKLIERARAAAETAGFSKARWLDGFFPVCAYIDETLLCSDWAGRGQWEQNQFQRKYYHTTAAGWLFFEKLDQLDDASADIRPVYEFCLALGFKGRYFRTSDMGKMDDIKYTQLKGVTDNVALDFPETPFPEAYESESAAKERKGHWWRTYSLFLPAAVLPPLLIFIALYVLFDRLLNDTIAQYFKTVF